MDLNHLYSIILDRKINLPSNSYTAKLLSSGEEAILRKIGEETIEVILAAKGQGDQRVIEEVSDLFYHTLVLLSAKDISFSDIENELERRHGIE